MVEGLERLLEAEVRGAGFKLYHWELIPGGRRRTLRVYLLDQDMEVNLDDCATVSRRLGPAIDSEEAIEGAYILEVSTPGMDRSLHTAWHYEIAMGQKVGIVRKVESGEDARVEGLIDAIEEGVVVVDLGERKVRINLDTIIRARLIPEYKIRKA